LSINDSYLISDDRNDGEISTGTDEDSIYAHWHIIDVSSTYSSLKLVKIQNRYTGYFLSNAETLTSRKWDGKSDQIWYLKS